MANDRRTPYRLSNGEVLEIGDRTKWAIDRLQQAIESLAKGDTSGYALVEVDHSARPRKTVASIDGENLSVMAEALVKQSISVREFEAIWQGNAPPASRSTSRH